MSATAIATVTKMMETLPEPAQGRVIEHLRDYIETLRDEMKWDEAFQATQPQLIAAARRARQQIAEGKAQPLDESQL